MFIILQLNTYIVMQGSNMTKLYFLQPIYGWRNSMISGVDVIT